jgi:hypothetical protein
MALCVIGLDAYFLNNPTLCFFSSNCDNYYSYYYQDQYSTDNLYSIKVPLIKGQLAAGVLMLVSCIGYIFIFALTSYRVGAVTPIPRNSSVPISILSQPSQYPNSTLGITLVENPINQSNVNYPIPPSYIAPVPVETRSNSIAPKNQLICPNCRSRFRIATQ